MSKVAHYYYQAGYLSTSSPNKYQASSLSPTETQINIGPQHPATHGILRLEVLLSGETVVEVVPHIGYLHRCFEKHASQLPYNQIIPFVDRMDYLAAMNTEYAFVMGVEHMLGLEGKLPKRVEYIRVLVAELNRIASHLLAIGTYGMDLGAFTAFLWLMRDREYILRLLEWLSGARMLYNYIWIGGLYYDLPIGFEEKCASFLHYLVKRLKEIEIFLVDNQIFILRTARVGVLSLAEAISYAASGPVLRASGLHFDLRRIDGYGVYPELEFDIPIGIGMLGVVGDCWDRNWIRFQECKESIKIIQQCIKRLSTDLKRDATFNPQKMVPKKIRTKAQDYYVRAENPRGEIGFFFRTLENSDVPFRCKARTPSFANLALLPTIAKGAKLADLIAILGSIDIVLGEIDR